MENMRTKMFINVSVLAHNLAELCRQKKYIDEASKAKLEKLNLT
jgi:hypothetical protein